VAFVPVSAAEAEGLTAYGIKAVVSQSRHRRHLIEALVEVATGDVPVVPSIRLSDRSGSRWCVAAVDDQGVGGPADGHLAAYRGYVHQRIRAKYAAVGYPCRLRPTCSPAPRGRAGGPEDVLTGPVTG